MHWAHIYFLVALYPCCADSISSLETWLGLYSQVLRSVCRWTRWKSRYAKLRTSRPRSVQVDSPLPTRGLAAPTAWARSATSLLSATRATCPPHISSLVRWARCPRLGNLINFTWWLGRLINTYFCLFVSIYEFLKGYVDFIDLLLS